MDQQTQEFNSKLTVMSIHHSIRDRDRNLNLPLSFVARLGSNYRALSYSFVDYKSFLKAQYLTFDSGFRNGDQNRLLSLNNWNTNLLKVHNYFMEYGNTSCYQMTHVQCSNQLIINNVSINVTIDPMTRKKTKVPTNIQQICDANMSGKYPKEWLQKYYVCKKRLVSHINNLNEMKQKMCDKTFLASVRLQLRFNDEDANHHLNSSAYARLIEEACHQLYVGIRASAKRIYSMSVCYWKEINVEIFSHCFVNFWHYGHSEKEGPHLYGTISVDTKCFRDKPLNQQISHCTGFVIKIVSLNSNKKAHL